VDSGRSIVGVKWASTYGQVKGQSLCYVVFLCSFGGCALLLNTNVVHKRPEDDFLSRN